MRFHLIDRLFDIRVGESARGRKLITNDPSAVDLSVVGGRYPAPLLLESLCQLGTWFIMASTECRMRAALLQVGSVEFHGHAVPGDVVELEAVVRSMTDEMAVLSGTATVDSAVIMRADDIMCALLPADRLDDPVASARILTTLTAS
ncbi:3-hydroxyacyl-ACP dehydratase FabZ family protein [Millisia brevis]|uniref:3-hydroxyacyl-ACP dehydratase FabZ family protein n=1 Tax=Millisia brevis TaxID=264148 RepID=UPI00082E7743|nr:hypothetical protein [Millisia brevis]